MIKPRDVDLYEVRGIALQLKRLAFGIPAPNELTPQLVLVAQHLERLCQEADMARWSRPESPESH